MLKQNLLLTFAVAFLSMAPNAVAHGGEHGEVQNKGIDGTISDSMCKADHSAMLKSGKYGKTASQCTSACIRQGQKPVLVSKNNHAVYSFTNPKLAKAHAGHAVHIDGHIDDASKTIHIHSIKTL